MTLAKMEARMAAERKAATRWVKRHGGGDVPSAHRTDTGESSRTQRTTGFAGHDRRKRESGESKVGLREGMVSYSEHGIEALLADAGASTEVLAGREQVLNADEDFLRTRFDYVLDQMTEAHRDVFVMRVYGQYTFSAIGEELGVTKQSAHALYLTAERNFRLLYGKGME